MTQVPLPYHQTPAQYHLYEGQYVYGGPDTSRIGLEIVNRPWGTPNMSNPSTFGSFGSNDGRSGQVQSSNNTLNPSSTPYIPSGYPPYLPQQQLGQGYQQGGHVGIHYPNNNPYPQMGGQGLLGSSVAQLQAAQFGMNPSLYSDFGTAGMGVNDYSQYVGPMQQSFGQPAGASPTVSHSSMSSTQNSFYGYGAAGAQHPVGYGGMNSSGLGGGMYINSGGFAVQNPQLAQTQPYNQSSNANRGKAAYFNGKQSTGSRPSSNLATAPVMNANAQNRRSGFKKQEKIGGPVLALSKSAKAASPSKSTKSLARGSSVDSKSGKAEEQHADDEGGPTPGPKNQPLNTEFSSEPRNTETPTLRSRRGQSIANIAVTDPSRKQSTANWLNDVSAMGNTSFQEGLAKFRSSPPKMMNLLASGGVDVGSLTTIAEHDPFTGNAGPTSRASVYNNPFAPAPIASMSSHFGGNTLIPPPVVSAQLRALTDLGRRTPTIDEVLDVRNLPFAEYCRLAKEHIWGVVRIKNVRSNMP